MKDIVDVFKALADPTRVRILLLLRDRDLCVCEIMCVLGMEQSRVSHQMRVLRQAGLVEDIREGRWVNYRIAPAARPVLDGLFGGSLCDRIEAASQTAADARKLEECLRKNIRGRACGTNARGKG
jgi:ArsR family transcriptional regulator, arsenate/arsenite/antimonite-responsive transcriptional repressor